MMTGLAYLQLFGYFLSKTHVATPDDVKNYGDIGDIPPFDVFEEIEGLLAYPSWDSVRKIFLSLD